MMRRVYKIITTSLVAVVLLACAPEGNSYSVNKYLCDFEGEYWDALVDSNPNGDNLVNGTIATLWHDEASDLVGEVSQPFPGYWEGAALSNHCSKQPDTDGTYDKQLYAYVDAPYSGSNFLICNGFMSGSVELRFDSKCSHIESMMVANTTYSRNVTGNGYRTAERPLGEEESIWIEARGYINGSDEVQATSKFFLYEKGAPSFEGWKKWYMTSMCKVDRVVFHICWDGTLEYNPYPAYFALDNIVVVRKELVE